MIACTKSKKLALLLGTVIWLISIKELFHYSSFFLSWWVGLWTFFPNLSILETILWHISLLNYKLWEVLYLELEKSLIWLSLLFWASLVAQIITNSPAVWETWVGSLGWEDPLEKRMATTPVFLPGEFHGQGNLAGYSLWGHKESHMTERLKCQYSNVCDFGKSF